MKKAIRIISFVLCFVMCLGILSGCGKEETPELTKSVIQKCLTDELKSKSYNFDSLDEFQYEFVDVSEEDLTKLKGYFSNKIPYQKVDTSFVLTSLDMDTTGYYSLIFVYYNDEWKVMFGYDKDKSEWEYVAKTQTSSKQIMADLKTVEFEGFKRGYVGTESNTTIKITDRDTKLKINKDDVFIEVHVKTDFAEYVIEVEMIYYFNNGKWVMSDAIVEEPKYWKLTYNSERIPSSPSEAAILEQLTKPTNFVTYVANPEYMESYRVTQVQQLAGVSNITFQYEFETVYKNIGVITYLVQIPYEWNDGEWIIEDTAISVKNTKINAMLGTWTANNGDYIEFTALEKRSDDKTGDEKSPYVLVGIYYKKTGTDIYAKYNVKCELVVPLRDNNWEGKINLWEAYDANAVEFKINAFSINVKDKQLVAGDYVFEKTADLEVIEYDVEGNPITDETTETEVTESPEVTDPTEITENPEDTESTEPTEITETPEEQEPEATPPAGVEG